MKALLFSFLFAVPIFAQLPGFSLPGVEPVAVEEASANTTARLISQTSSFIPGETLLLGVELTMKKDWHTYWINPGDSGLPTSIDWELPEGFEAGEIQWPTPIRFVFEGLVSFGYKEEVVLQVPVKTSPDIPIGSTTTFNARVDWLECKDVCLPGGQDVSLDLMASNKVIEGVWGTDPGLPEEWTGATVLPEEGGVKVTLEGFEGKAASFFPLAEGVWTLEPEPSVTQADTTVTITLQASGLGDVPENVEGVLVDTAGNGWSLNAIPPSTMVGTEDAVVAQEEEQKGILYYLVFAFIAGVGMNLLPCIFPVLGLKISGFVEQAQGDMASVRKHALVFASGVVISLWILAAVVGVLGAAWGGQFQDPRVVIGMALILTFFSLSLFGVFELGNKLTTVGGDLTNKQGYAGSFFQGVLMTVIGTPCTGPVLAVVIVWMLTQPVWIGFLAFTLMGLGMSAPYVALAYSPKLIEKLPRPGTWMVTFKKASAFMIVLFIWVMLYVLAGLIPVAGVVRVVGALLMVCFAAWVLGTWAAPGRSPKSMAIAKLTTVVLLALSGWVAYSYKAPVTEVTDSLQAKIESGVPIRWSDVSEEVANNLIAQGVPVHYRPYSPELVEELRADGKAVFVDFTADWCTICKINKVRALHREDVMKAFAEKDVVTLRADWTARDPVISAVLEDYGRRGVPVYQLFDNTPGDRATLLSETLTPGVVFEALETL